MLMLLNFLPQKIQAKNVKLNGLLKLVIQNVQKFAPLINMDLLMLKLKAINVSVRETNFLMIPIKHVKIVKVKPNLIVLTMKNVSAKQAGKINQQMMLGLKQKMDKLILVT